MKSKEQKRTEGSLRNNKWRALSLVQQLAYLDKHFPGGAKRQRKRLLSKREDKA